MLQEVQLLGGDRAHHLHCVIRHQPRHQGGDLMFSVACCELVMLLGCHLDVGVSFFWCYNKQSTSACVSGCLRLSSDAGIRLDGEFQPEDN